MQFIYLLKFSGPILDFILFSLVVPVIISLDSLIGILLMFCVYTLRWKSFKFICRHLVFSSSAFLYFGGISLSPEPYINCVQQSRDHYLPIRDWDQPWAWVGRTLLINIYDSDGHYSLVGKERWEQSVTYTQSRFKWFFLSRTCENSKQLAHYGLYTTVL